MKVHYIRFPVLLIGLILLAGILCKQLIDKQSDDSVRIETDGLSHNHAHDHLNGYGECTDICVVGIGEPDKNGAGKLADRCGADTHIVCDDQDHSDKTGTAGRCNRLDSIQFRE